MSDDNIQAARVKWRLRRGMLELDALFHRFYHQEFDQLDSKQKDLFEKLLEETDADLYRWFIGMEEPDDDEFKSLVEKIRQT